MANEVAVRGRGRPPKNSTFNTCVCAAPYPLCHSSAHPFARTPPHASASTNIAYPRCTHLRPAPMPLQRRLTRARHPNLKPSYRPPDRALPLLFFSVILSAVMTGTSIYIPKTRLSTFFQVFKHLGDVPHVPRRMMCFSTLVFSDAFSYVCEHVTPTQDSAALKRMEAIAELRGVNVAFLDVLTNRAAKFIFDRVNDIITCVLFLLLLLALGPQSAVRRPLPSCARAFSRSLRAHAYISPSFPRILTSQEQPGHTRSVAALVSHPVEPALHSHLHSDSGRRRWSSQRLPPWQPSHLVRHERERIGSRLGNLPRGAGYRR